MVARATTHGLDLGGPAVARNRFRSGHSGATFWDEDLARLLIYDVRGRGLFGADGALVHDTRADKIFSSDHFKASTINASWNLNKGSDAQTVNFAVDTTIISGGVKGTTGDAGTGVAADGVAISINNPVQRATTKRNEFSVSYKIDAVTSCQFFIGFTDVLPATTLEAPFTLSGTTLTSTATDAAGILFDTAATTDTLRLVSVANDVDGTAIDTGVAFAADTWYDLLVSILPDGSVDFQVKKSDDTQFSLGSNHTLAAGSLRTGVDLYPIVQGDTRTTTVRNVSLDFALLRQLAA
jgi:hypothetical protein